MKCINRTITSTTAYGQAYDPDTQEYQDFTCVFDGELSVSECNNQVRKTNPFVMVTHTEHETHTYSMPLDFFIANASIVK